MTHIDSPGAFGDPALREAVAGTLKDVALSSSHDDLPALARQHWRLAAEMGWTAALVPENLGGLALGMGFAADLCEEAGRHLFCGPLTETAVLLPALAREAPQLEELLPSVASGVVRLAYAESDRLDGTTVSALAEHALAATHFVFLHQRKEELAILLAPAGSVAVTLLQPMDLSSTVGRVELVNPHACISHVLDAAAARRVLAGLHVAVAADLLGVGEASLARTVVHVLERKQFGQQIGRFQAIKHRLADVHTALSAARLAVAQAVGPDATFEDARHARILAADAATKATAAAIQFHGGLGFSWEFELHFYLKRARRVSARNGGTISLRAEAGESIIAAALAASA
jgi:alkylation response protein AidB-like acyl-CoA dehydrogenase